MPSHPLRVEDHFAAYPSHVSEIADARAGFTTWMAGWAAGDEEACDLTLALSELLANAITASATGAPVLVSASCDETGTVLEVANRPGQAGDAAPDWDLSDELRGGGRGLLIVDAVVDDLHVERREGWATVCCRHSHPMARAAERT